MSQLFARIELRGTPGEDVYEELHEYMKSRNWSQQITGSKNTVDLPHATYQGKFTADEPNCSAVAKDLKEYIRANIWAKAIVLVIRSATWAQSSS